ncbi:hypothetical protein HK104_008529 [Borealophlyctis nickersoniae]|nr:hypothetical protein HK104_008529 [Borealophlyctis nickersoniae]
MPTALISFNGEETKLFIPRGITVGHIKDMIYEYNKDDWFGTIQPHSFYLKQQDGTKAYTPSVVPAGTVRYEVVVDVKIFSVDATTGPMWACTTQKLGRITLSHYHTFHRRAHDGDMNDFTILVEAIATFRDVNYHYNGKQPLDDTTLRVVAYKIKKFADDDENPLRMMFSAEDLSRWDVVDKIETAE